jgi:photosystem II stability/assembly factor-like uncharacterized protein
MSLDRTRVVFAVVLLATTGCAVRSDWDVEELPTRAEYEGVVFLDSDYGFIVGGNHFIEGGIIGVTTDGGRSWEFESGLVRAKAGFRFTDIVFVDQSTGFIAGSHGVILRTVDRGQRWHIAWRGSGTLNHFLDLFFLDDGQHGWAVGHSGFRTTSDGGLSWAPAASDRDVGGSSVFFIDRDHGFVAGKFGRIFATDDGGESWTVVDRPTGTGQPDLLAITFVGPNRGWVVGENGAILHTRDGGRSWDWQTSGVRARLCAVSFVDPNLGWVVGHDRSASSSVILTTTDGGERWEIDHEIDGELLRTAAFLDASHGWAVGERPEHGAQRLLRFNPR